MGTPFLRTALTLLPPCVLAMLVFRFGVDVPFWDQWVMVDHLSKAASGEWPWAELWRPHNEHRLFFPQLLMLVLARLSDWNIRLEMAVGVLLACAALAAVVWLARQTLGRRTYIFVLPLMSLLIFSPSQWENWLWGWQIQIFLNVAAVVTGFALLVRVDKPGRLTAAILCGIVATFSFANGILFWVLALPSVARPRGQRFLRVSAWIFLAMTVTELFLEGYGGGHADRFLLWQEDPLQAAKLFGGYVSIYLSAPLLGFHGPTALYGGFLMLVGLAALGVRQARPDVVSWLLGVRLPWLQLIGYAAASAALTAMGRLHLNLGQALSSRYLTVSTLFWIGILGLWALSGRDASGRDRAEPSPPGPLSSKRQMGSPFRPRYGTRIAAFVGVVLVILHGIYGIGRMVQAHEERAVARRLLQTHATDSDALSVLYPDVEWAAQRARVLEEKGLGPFARPD